MLRGLTWSCLASSLPLQCLPGSVFMIVVMRCLRVGGCGGRGVRRSRWVLPGFRSTGGVQMVMSIAVMVAGRSGRPSSRAW